MVALSLVTTEAQMLQSNLENTEGREGKTVKAEFFVKGTIF